MTRAENWVPWAVAGVLFACLLVGAYVGLPYVRKERASADAARKEASTARARMSEAEEQRQGLESRIRALEEEKQALTAGRDALMQDLKTQHGQNAAAQEAAEQLSRALQADVAKGDVRIAGQPDGKIRIELPDRAIFNAEGRLSPRGDEALGRLASAVSSLNPAGIEVSGRVDESAARDAVSVWEASSRKAAMVVARLSAYDQLRGVQWLASGAGKGRQRRIELSVSLPPPGPPPRVAPAPPANARRGAKR